MNIDRFGDSIRRKLESIRPDYTERDWARMQATLQQAQLQTNGMAEPVVRPLWANRTAWLAAAMISTVVLFAHNVWQRQQIKELRRSVQALNQPKTTASSRPASPSQVDTVYITRYVPLSSNSANSTPDAVTQRPESVAELYVRTEVPAMPTGRSSGQSVTAKPSSNSTLSRPTVAYEKNNTSRQTNPVTLPAQNNQTLPSDNISRIAPSVRQTETVSGNPPNVATSEGNSQIIRAEPPTEPATEAIQINALASKVMLPESVDWGKALNRRARPIREQAVAATIRENQTAPESQPVKTPVQFRLGVASDINRLAWSVGAVGELVIGKNWVIGLGLVRSNQLMGRFLTDFEFNTQTRRDFRREFARGLDPRREVLNIDVRQVQLQIPITLSYRVPLSRSVAIAPNIGTYISLSNRETVSFYYREAFNKFDEARFSDNRPVELMNNYTVGTNLEWQRGHWAAQGGPLLTVPLKTTPRWEASTALGARLRVMYVF
ncbi:hypothetical protein [Spirosoma montaniterrae]|uniref:Outer membrane protein beta-barrel domain-containing protein n=1 Tax=Spirosoma montaniterrae TaxID=1178516 RepID=A0A1P9WXE7_9BACT|nr:hypothetical protein [Spirosoma montaniterrae]AQG80039.1 hypothetical protein AWR27_12325 [Spirosoma montaniterrae]